MKRIFIINFLVLLSLILFVSCGDGEENSGESSTSEPDITVSQTIPTVIDFDVTTLLSKEEVEDILGVDVSEPQVMERGEEASFSSDDGTTLLTVSVEEADFDEFNEGLSNYSDLIDAPNLADSAKWSKENRLLILFSKKYILTFYLEHGNSSSEELLLLSRQLALKSLEHLK